MRQRAMIVLNGGPLAWDCSKRLLPASGLELAGPH